jgi:FtsH-binding integral membrane protein
MDLKFRNFEWFLIELAFYFVLWLINDYIATLVSLIFIVIFSAILIVALISELIEPSKVPRSYFWFMVVSILAPLLAGLVFLIIIGGDLNWIKAPFSL